MASYSSAEEVLADWVAALNGGNYSAAAKLYHAAAVLVPTFAERPLTTPAEIAGYFDGLQQFDRVEVVLNEGTVTAQEFTDSLHCTSGLYSWGLEKEGEIAVVVARFSYLMDLSASAPIRHHHSSAVPKGI